MSGASAVIKRLPDGAAGRLGGWLAGALVIALISGPGGSSNAVSYGFRHSILRPRVIPFLLVAGYALKLTTRGDTYEAGPDSARRRDIFIAAVAVVYTGFLLYAGGLKFIVLSAILYAPGSALYFWARREQGKKLFDRTLDLVIFILAAIAAVVGVYWIATGYIVL